MTPNEQMFQTSARTGAIRIGGLEPCSLLDFPGRISAVLFLSGCNLDCGYCHNRALIKPATGASKTWAETSSFFHARRQFLDGVVVSGGEPTLHPTLPELLAEIREMGYAIKLDTNGTRPAVLARLIEQNLLDYVAMDVKAAPQDARAWLRVCGTAVDVAAIRESIQLLSNTAEKMPSFSCEFRTTAAPGLDMSDMLGIGAALNGVAKWAIQRYRPVEGCIGTGLDNHALAELRSIAGPLYGIKDVILRG